MYVYCMFYCIKCVFLFVYIVCAFMNVYPCMFDVATCVYVPQYSCSGMLVV